MWHSKTMEPRGTWQERGPSGEPGEKNQGERADAAEWVRQKLRFEPDAAQARVLAECSRLCAVDEDPRPHFLSSSLFTTTVFGDWMIDSRNRSAMSVRYL